MLRFTACQVDRCRCILNRMLYKTQNKMILSIIFLSFTQYTQFSYAQNDLNINQNHQKNSDKIVKKSQPPVIHVCFEEESGNGKSHSPKITIFGMNALKSMKIEQNFNPNPNGKMDPPKGSFALFQIDF